MVAAIVSVIVVHFVTDSASAGMLHNSGGIINTDR